MEKTTFVKTVSSFNPKTHNDAWHCVPLAEPIPLLYGAWEAVLEVPVYLTVCLVDPILNQRTDHIIRYQ